MVGVEPGENVSMYFLLRENVYYGVYCVKATPT